VTFRVPNLPFLTFAHRGGQFPRALAYVEGTSCTALFCFCGRSIMLRHSEQNSSCTVWGYILDGSREEEEEKVKKDTRITEISMVGIPHYQKKQNNKLRLALNKVHDGTL
jgi:hypothetical protein